MSTAWIAWHTIIQLVKELKSSLRNWKYLSLFNQDKIVFSYNLVSFKFSQSWYYYSLYTFDVLIENFLYDLEKE